MQQRDGDNSERPAQQEKERRVERFSVRERTTIYEVIDSGADGGEGEALIAAQCWDRITANTIRDALNAQARKESPDGR